MSRSHAARAASTLAFVALVAGVAGCAPADTPTKRVGDKTDHTRIVPTAPVTVPSPSATSPAPLVLEHGFLIGVDDDEVEP